MIIFLISRKYFLFFWPNLSMMMSNICCTFLRWSVICWSEKSSDSDMVIDALSAANEIQCRIYACSQSSLSLNDTVSWTMLPETVNYFLLNHEGEKILTPRIRDGKLENVYINAYLVAFTIALYIFLKYQMRFHLCVTIGRKILKATLNSICIYFDRFNSR